MANEKQAAKAQPKMTPSYFVDDNGFAYHKSAYFDAAGKSNARNAQVLWL